MQGNILHESFAKDLGLHRQGDYIHISGLGKNLIVDIFSDTFFNFIFIFNREL